MRLGGLYPRLPRQFDSLPPAPPELLFARTTSIHDLDRVAEQLDAYGLSAIGPPANVNQLPDDDCARYGERAASLGMVIGELGGTPNMMTRNAGLFAERLERLRSLIRKAEIMGCRTVHILAGSDDPSDHQLAPSPYLFTDACRARLREIVLRALDGFQLQRTRFLIEPYCNTFFYQPEDIRAFLDSVDHPSVGLQLDIVNMISYPDYFNTAGLIERTFKLLGDRIFSAHMKDVRWDHSHLILKWDEVLVGDGVLDYAAYLTRVAALPADTTCYCEHLPTVNDYAVNFSRLHDLAGKAGVRFLGRGESSQPN